MAASNPEMAKQMSQMGIGAKPQVQRKNTKEEQDFETAQREVDRMTKESLKYQTPEHFAKYGKMQRQLVKMEKEVKKLKDLADKSQLTAGDDDNQLLIEEAKNVEEPQLVPDSP